MGITSRGIVWPEHTADANVVSDLVELATTIDTAITQRFAIWGNNGAANIAAPSGQAVAACHLDLSDLQADHAFILAYASGSFMSPTPGTTNILWPWQDADVIAGIQGPYMNTGLAAWSRALNGNVFYVIQSFHGGGTGYLYAPCLAVMVVA